MARAILLNGTSSAGKTSLARALQRILDPPPLYFGVDAFLFAFPPQLHQVANGVRYVPMPLSTGGTGTAVEAGADGMTMLRACHRAMAELVRNGTSVVLDEVLFADDLRDSYLDAFRDLPLTMVKVSCDQAVADRREAARKDRVAGLSAGIAEIVHAGIDYDVEVDTTSQTPEEAAAFLAAALGRQDR